MKKLINDPQNVVPEMLEGLLRVYGEKAQKHPRVNAIIRGEIPEGRVSLLVGGGSGHEPVYHGLVGQNMAAAAAVGGVFSAPPAQTILEATRSVDRGAGVLYVYGNYSGDNMNFDLAAEMASEEGLATETVRIADDVAIADRAERRGIAGLLFVVKIAGAACATMTDLAAAAAITRKAEQNTRSMGIALSSGSIPETGRPTFELGDEEMEIGMGLHGEPGVRRGRLMQADRVVEEMMERILTDLPFGRGDRVAVLINDLGATTAMELYIVNRKVSEILDQGGVAIHDTVIGSYCTSQEMAGVSISLLRLDEQLRPLYDLPARCPAFRSWS